MNRIALYAVVVALFCATPTFAYGQETETTSDESAETDNSLDSLSNWHEPIQLRPHQGWRFGGQALMAPVWFFIGILNHETSHVVMGAACGFEVSRFYPYPVVVPIQQNAETEPVNTFYLGFTGFEPRPVSEIRDYQVALTTIAPFLTDTLLFTTGDLLLTYAVDPHSVGAPFILAGLMMTPLADFIIGLFTMNEGGDLRQFSDAAGIPVGVSAGIGWAMAIVGLWRVTHQFRRVFMEPRGTPHPEERSVSFSPFIGGDAAGLGMAGRF